MDRGDERRFRAALTSAANIATRGATFLTTLITIPMTAAYLGSERFGLWMTITSFFTLLSFADLGIGNGLLTEVASASGSNDKQSVRRNISSAFAILSVVALTLAGCMSIVIHSVNWPAFFGLRETAAISETAPALYVFLAFFVLGIPLSVVANTQLGLQMGFVAAGWQAAGSIFAFISILGAIHWHASLSWLLGALLGGPILAAAGNNIAFFWHTHPEWRPTRSDMSRISMNRLLRQGALYFVLQLAMALAYASDNAILARDRGAVAVGDYAITAKLFGASAIIVSILLQPLWPAYAEALARRHFAWIRRTLLRSSCAVSLIATAISIALLLAFDPMVTLWVHRTVPATLSLQIGLAFWSVIDAVGVSLAMFLNAAHVVKFQVILATVFSLTCFALKLWLVAIYGATMLPWVTVLLYMPMVLLPVLWNLKQWLPPKAKLQDDA
jgi:O-antigen/teichoic acid export membrane protein